MKKALLILLQCVIIAGCSLVGTDVSTGSSKTSIVWAKAIVGASTNEAEYNSIAADSEGNVVIAGYISGHGAYAFGNGVYATAGGTGDESVIIAKYDAKGNALWARTIVNAAKNSRYNAIATDQEGNIYAVGYLYNWDQSTYWLSDTISLTGKGNMTPLLAKYSKDGTLLWARTAEKAYSQTVYNGIALDSMGNIYAVGQVKYSVDLGNDVSVENSWSGVLIAKYSSDGNVLWAKGVCANTTIDSCFNTVTCNKDGNIYAAGYLSGYGTCYFDAHHSATYGNYPKENIIAVKYDGDGNVLDVDPKNMSNGFSSVYNSMYTASSSTRGGDFVFAGKATYYYPYALDDSATVSGDSISLNGLFVKFESAGGVSGAFCGGFGDANESEYYGIATNSRNNAYMVGDLDTDDEYGYQRFGLLVKADSSGELAWSNIYEEVNGEDLYFKSIAIDANDNIYIVGSMTYDQRSGLVMKIAEHASKGMGAKSINHSGSSLPVTDNVHYLSHILRG